MQMSEKFREVSTTWVSADTQSVARVNDGSDATGL